MTYEQMLAWLDQADSPMVHGAADRLRTAAEELEKIGDELKIRPQYVSWKGEGAEAFRTWSADLANATLRLGEFSKESARWLSRAAGMITEVKSAFPHSATTGEAQANLDAAEAAPNDPDADAVARKSSGELKGLAADKEYRRQEAIHQMERLANVYGTSVTEMDKLERPRVPPPPKAIQPATERRGEVVSHGISNSGASSPGNATGLSPSSGLQRPVEPAGVYAPGASAPHVPEMRGPEADSGRDTSDAVTRPAPSDSGAVGMEIDTITPPSPTLPSGGPPLDFPNGGRPDLGRPQPMDMIPPMVGGGPPPPSSGRNAFTGDRPPILPGQGRLPESGAGRLPNNPGPTVGGQGTPRDAGRSATGGRPPMVPGSGPMGPGPGQTPRNNGVVGGRPVPQPPGRATGLPRGTVIGGEAPGAYGRGPIGTTAGGGTSRLDTERRGGAPQRRLPNPATGIVGGRPQQASSPGRSFTPGGSGLVHHNGNPDDGSERTGENPHAGQQDDRRADPPAGDRP